MRPRPFLCTEFERNPDSRPHLAPVQDAWPFPKSILGRRAAQGRLRSRRAATPRWQTCRTTHSREAPAWSPIPWHSIAGSRPRASRRICPGQSGRGHQLRSARPGETFATVATSVAARLAPQVCVVASVAQSLRQAYPREGSPHRGGLPAGLHYQLRRSASFSSSDEAAVRSHGTESDEKDPCHPPDAIADRLRSAFLVSAPSDCLLLAGPLIARWPTAVSHGRQEGASFRSAEG